MTLQLGRRAEISFDQIFIYICVDMKMGTRLLGCLFILFGMYIVIFRYTIYRMFPFLLTNDRLKSHKRNLGKQYRNKLHVKISRKQILCLKYQTVKPG